MVGVRFSAGLGPFRASVPLGPLMFALILGPFVLMWWMTYWMLYVPMRLACWDLPRAISARKRERQALGL